MDNRKRSVYIIDGARSPFLKATVKPNPLSAVDLALAVVKPLLQRQSFNPKEINEVIVGCGAPNADEMNIARLVALRGGCGINVPAWTVQRNCASGLQAIDAGVSDIALGKVDLVLAGGAECMSRAPWLLQDDMVSWLADLRSTKHFYQKLAVLAKFRFQFLVPVIGLLKGLKDPVVDLSMGQTAEKLAFLFNISRAAMDKYANESRLRVLSAREKGYFEEIIAIFDGLGNVIENDTGVRTDSSIEKLAQLPPVFDKPFGLLTAGNSSQITDGAAFVILASESAVNRYQLPVLGRIVETTWSALDPSVMGLGPVHAISALLAKTKLTLKDIDYFEINEAYAAQVLACLKAMESEQYCREKLGLSNALGTIPIDILNIDGGAISIGHPIGASGARLVLHMLHILKRHQAKRGIVSLCIGGGQGGAMLIESEKGVR